MINKVFSVFDSKAGIYMEPFRAATPAVAMRGFIDSANNPQSIIGKHPEDYSLWMLGEFDDAKGTWVNIIPGENLGTASSFVKVG